MKTERKNRGKGGAEQMKKESVSFWSDTSGLAVTALCPLCDLYVTWS